MVVSYMLLISGLQLSSHTHSSWHAVRVSLQPAAVTKHLQCVCVCVFSPQGGRKILAKVKDPLHTRTEGIHNSLMCVRHGFPHKIP